MNKTAIRVIAVVLAALMILSVGATIVGALILS